MEDKVDGSSRTAPSFISDLFTNNHPFETFFGMLISVFRARFFELLVSLLETSWEKELPRRESSTLLPHHCMFENLLVIIGNCSRPLRGLIAVGSAFSVQQHHLHLAAYQQIYLTTEVPVPTLPAAAAYSPVRTYQARVTKPQSSDKTVVPPPTHLSPLQAPYWSTIKYIAHTSTPHARTFSHTIPTDMFG
ncbi:hypothetical protein CLF_100271 [Clonorchis sinensis]|uniref:Uncharacterized protein n=1 Tax=Clonorchis sinensis TaxID=79923 RepID=G7Y303_CLOSI|nr:hypothetical protein CLF_100271 [Clonorchis sinensis]